MSRGKKSKKVDQKTMTPEMVAKVNEWYAKQQQLATLKEEEMKLRNEIVINAGFDMTKLEGSETLDLDAIWPGWKMKAVKELNRSMTNENGESTALQYALHPVRPDLAANIVKWKPELSITTYRELEKWLETADKNDVNVAAVREALAKAMTSKPGAPQLSLVPPKAEEAATATTS